MSILLNSKQARAYMLLFADSILHILALLAAGVLRHGTSVFIGQMFLSKVYITSLLLVELFYGFMYVGGITARQDDAVQGNFYALINILRRQIPTLLFVMVYLFATKQSEDISRITLVTFGCIDILFEFIVRLLFRRVFRFYARHGAGADRVLAVCLYDMAEKIAEQFEKTFLKNLTGFIILDKDKRGESVLDIPIVGGADDIFMSYKNLVYDEVFLQIPYGYDIHAESIILAFEQMGIPVNLNVDVFGLSAENKEIGTMGPYHVITFRDRSRKFLPQLVKRFMDIIGALTGMLLLIPITIILAPIIKLQSKGPVFFSQIRVGMNGRRFKMYKFRSMVADAELRKNELRAANEMDGPMFKIADDPRITKVGRFIRRTSLDEFPQFFNVLRGDMSLVGTRPPTVDEYEKYNSSHVRRLSIKPGITGLWQVSGRNNIKSFEEVVKLDFSYIDNWSLLLDIKIILQTIGQLFVGNKNPENPSEILGVKIAPLDMRAVLRYTKENIKNWSGRYMCFCNVHTTIMSYENQKLRDIENAAVLTLADGKPLSVVARKRGCKTIDRVAGPDFMAEIFRISVENGYRHVFYGSTEMVIASLKENLMKKYPGIDIADMISPPFGDITEEEDAEFVRRINAANADFVWIGLGAPKQEYYMARHEGCINGLMVGVGAGFEFMAGTRKRAPKWMQKLCLEWLYRMLQDPKRLISRYMGTNWKFLRLVRKENRKRKKGAV